MKRLTALLIGFIFAAFSLVLPVESDAANSATAQTALKMTYQGFGPITPYVVAIDTTGQDLTIDTPPSGTMTCIAGLAVSEANAATLTFKSGTTTIWVPELTTYQGILLPLGAGLLTCTQPGEALKIQSSAAISSMLIHLVEGTWIELK